jgi:hypothetical protein
MSEEDISDFLLSHMHTKLKLGKVQKHKTEKDLKQISQSVYTVVRQSIQASRSVTETRDPIMANSDDHWNSEIQAQNSLKPVKNTRLIDTIQLILEHITYAVYLRNRVLFNITLKCLVSRISTLCRFPWCSN